MIPGTSQWVPPPVFTCCSRNCRWWWKTRTLIRDVSNWLAGHLGFSSSLLPKLLRLHVSRDQVILLSPFLGTSVLKYLHCWPLHRILKPLSSLGSVILSPPPPSPTALSLLYFSVSLPLLSPLLYLCPLLSPLLPLVSSMKMFAGL